MKSFPLIIASRLWQYRVAGVATLLLATIVAASQLAGLTVSNSMAAWFPDQDSAVSDYEEFRRTFGSDEIVVVAVSAAESFVGEAGSERIGQLTDRFLDIPGVATVTSRVTVPRSLQSAQDRLLSPDGLTTVLLVQLLDGGDIEQHRRRILADLDEAASGFGLQVRLAGYGVIYAALNEASTSGASGILLAAHVLMFIVLWCFLRQAKAAVATLLAVSVASILTLGLFVGAGQQLNMVTMALPTLVLVIGIADCVHLIRSVERQSATYSIERRVVRGVAAVIGPCFVATLTTAAGFLVLSTSGIAAIRSLGWFAALGMVLAFVCVFTLLPALLPWVRPAKFAQADLPSVFARWLCRVAQNRPILTVTASVILLFGSGFGIARLDVDTYSIGYLDTEHRVRRDSDFIESMIAPYAPIDFTLTSSKNILRPATLDALQSWQRRITQVTDATWSWSLLDALATPADRAPSSMPAGWLQRKLRRLQNFAPVTASSMIAGERQLRVTFGAPMMSAKKLRRLINEIRDRADFPDDVTVKAAGYAPLYARIIDELVQSQVRSFSFALVLVLALLAIATRSAKRLLLAVPANLLPVLLTLGVMGLTGIPLDVATITIATIIFGLVVDDTVHLLHPAGTADRPLSEAVAESVRQRGGSLLVTSVVLAAGFLVFGLAEVRSITWFGLLISFAVVAAIVADLTLLPAVARLMSRKAFRPAIGRTVV